MEISILFDNLSDLDEPNTDSVRPFEIIHSLLGQIYADLVNLNHISSPPLLFPTNPPPLDDQWLINNLIPFHNIIFFENNGTSTVFNDINKSIKAFLNLHRAKTMQSIFRPSLVLLLAHFHHICERKSRICSRSYIRVTSNPRNGFICSN